MKGKKKAWQLTRSDKKNVFSKWHIGKGKVVVCDSGELGRWRESGWWNKQNIKILLVGDKSKESEFKGGQFGNDVESTFFYA